MPYTVLSDCFVVTKSHQDLIERLEEDAVVDTFVIEEATQMFVVNCFGNDVCPV